MRTTTPRHRALPAPRRAPDTAEATAPVHADTRPAVLLVSASMGAGHDGVAYELARRMQASGARADVVDYLDFLPLRLGRVVKRAYLAQLRYAPETYEWLYANLDRNRAMEAVADAFAGLARRRLLRAVRRGRYGLAVATYPLAGQALGRLRREERLDVPALTFLTDPDVHEMWLDEGTDAYLAVYTSTAEEALRRGARAALVVGPVIPPVHASPVTAAERECARRSLGLAGTSDPVVLVVAGSWGAGDVERTVAALADGAAARAIVLCGRNAELRERLEERTDALCVGWTDDVRRLLAASDVVVHNAGGLSSLEGFGAGVPVIGHACLPGHGRRNAAVMRDNGVAAMAADDRELVGLVRRYAGTDEGRAMSGRARALFQADPTPLLLERARPVPQRRRLAAAPRRVPRAVTATAVLAALALPVSGPSFAFAVSEAAEHGIGVTRPPQSTDAVFVGALLDAREVASPEASAALVRRGISAVVPGAVAAAAPDSVRRMRADGVSILTGPCPMRGGLHLMADRRRVLDSARLVASASGQSRAPVVVPPDSPRSVLLTRTATTVGLADAVVQPDVLPRLRDAEEVVLDLRGVDPSDVDTDIAAFEADAREQGLAVRPWGGLWRL
ncbi:UDP-N-acetylglucosamine:LPS N-acetylglucosamine transferase [Motilibacter rhizosphaerae]|uniref:UDP-N-acetylglucosamine:LPS N-acetylglucosamine transferase n=1 Tax=Motilibacter rhizosphaerae TaxID=598652 RepID=A0A4Q7NPU6_9ACTN|nr:hypothetical protein [Motilibacter rhizosphaerae]RZS87345.1 UDP-N-acetylglucosamine:LPS N-acetylglucosamine transferase [Motilibacter rhizosphaerae]